MGTESEEVKALRERIDLLKLQADLAQAQAQLAAARLPSSDQRGAEGTVELADVEFYGKILAHEGLRSLAQEIVADVPRSDKEPKGTEGEGSNAKPEKHKPPIFITTDPGLLKGLAFREELRFQVAALEKGYRDAGTAAAALREARVPDLAPLQSDLVTLETLTPLSVLSALPGVLGAATELASFFRVDVSVKGGNLDISSHALLAEGARAASEHWSVQLVPPTDPQGILPRVARLVAEKDLRAAELADLKKATGIPKDPLTELEAGLKTLDASFASLQKELFESKENPDLAYQVRLADAHGKVPVLWMAIEAAGTESIVTKGPWKTKVSHLGGAVVSYFYFDETGVVVTSGVLSSWDGRTAPARHLEQLR